MNNQDLRYSFDIFDTLLTRTVSRPVDVFRFVQNRILAQDDVPMFLRHRFVPARVWAEFKARRLVHEEDVSLENIYGVLSKDFALASEVAERLLETELLVESLCIVPIEKTVERVRQLRHSCEKIVFASDMYLPEVFIHERLQEHGIFHPGDSLYVSGELGITKGSGRLYQYILEQEKIEPGQLVHCGDNHHSDAVVPARMGIRLDPATRKLGLDGVGFAPGFRAKVRYGFTLLRARFDLGVNRIV